MAILFFFLSVQMAIKPNMQSNKTIWPYPVVIQFVTESNEMKRWRITDQRRISGYIVYLRPQQATAIQLGFIHHIPRN